MAYAVVRTDNLAGTDVRGQLVSVKYMGADGQTPTVIENGNVLRIGTLMTGEREIYVGAAPTASDNLDDIVLIASPEVMYDERKRNLDDYINEEGKTCRGYHIHAGDTFSVTAEALSGSPAAGSAVTLAASTKLAVGGAGTPIGRIVAVDVVGRHTYYAIKVGE